MLEQEVASIIKFALESAGNPSPYYWEVPEGFIVPAIYFPVPEIDSSGYTLYAYALTYTMFVKAFHSDVRGAHELAQCVLNAVKERRGVIPLIDKNGAYTGERVRLHDPTSKTIEGSTGTVQIMLSWESSRAYLYEEVKKSGSVVFDLHRRGAFAKATGVPDPETSASP